MPSVSRTAQIEDAVTILNNNEKILDLFNQNLMIRRKRDVSGGWSFNPGNDPTYEVSDEDAIKLGFTNASIGQDMLYQSLDVAQQFLDSGWYDVLTRASSKK